MLARLKQCVFNRLLNAARSGTAPVLSGSALCVEGEECENARPPNLVAAVAASLYYASSLFICPQKTFSKHIKNKVGQDNKAYSRCTYSCPH